MTTHTLGPRRGRVIEIWTPEDKAFWEREGEAVAKINLWISVPALFLAFAIWQVWSVVAVTLPALGFNYSTNQLFWLAAAPALSGATLRIFYSFMVPLVGGRRWTAISTASLLIPALGIGFAVQDSSTGYPTMLILALLCGLGGGNFSSSMANISFFFPKERKGSALGINAGLGNLGVSVVQFLSPLVVTAGIFGVFGGEAQNIVKNNQAMQVWTQNAAFVWVPWIALAALAAAAALLGTRVEVYVLYGAIVYATLVLAYHPSLDVPGFRRFGDYSYGIYVYAYPTQQAIASVLGPMPPLLLFGLAYPAIFALAYASWHAIEAPALRFKRAKGVGLKPDPQPR